MLVPADQGVFGWGRGPTEPVLVSASAGSTDIEAPFIFAELAPG
jgi:hypothetical protein